MVLAEEKIALQGLDRLTDDEFAALAAANRDLRMERDEKGNIIIMSPVHTITGFREARLAAVLDQWNLKTDLGYTFSSSAGFKLPNSAIRSPDAAWISNEVWRSLSKEKKEGYAQVCPEFIAELRSNTDALKQSKEKMVQWIENGAKLGWLIDPVNEHVYIYRPDKEVEFIENFEKPLSGETLLPGFSFDLKQLRMKL